MKGIWAALAIAVIMFATSSVALAQESLPKASKTCRGRWINPIKDVCWNCMLPIRVGGVAIWKGKVPDPGGAPAGPLCACATPFPRIGIPISYWDPHRVADVTAEAWCFPNLGGFKMDVGIGAQDGEATSAPVEGGASGAGLQHVHYYSYPLLVWMQLLGDTLCLQGSSFDLLYITEIDPLYNDDELASLINPEAALFANPIADAACVADCVAATTRYPIKSLFWCAGCQGSMYPMSGRSSNTTQVSNSFHVLEKFMYKMHRQLMTWGTVGSKALCKPYLMPVMDRTMYRFQMTQPNPHVGRTSSAIGAGSGEPGLGALICPRIGGSTMMWDSNRITPYVGEDIGYLIWRRRDCCAL